MLGPVWLGGPLTDHVATLMPNVCGYVCGYNSAMTQATATRPTATPWTHEGPHLYPHGVVAGSENIRRFRIDDELWEAYAEVVGERNRSADIRDYIEWRIEHPDTPLPGRWRGPRRKKKHPRD